MAADLGPAGSSAPSVCEELRPGAPMSDAHASHLQLRLPLPPGVAADAAAGMVYGALRPKPAWVAARCFESLEFVAAWGDERQPIRQKLKSNLAQWLRLAPEAVKGAFAAQALKAWRFEAVAAVRKLRYQPSAPERPAELDFSVAGDLTPAKLNALLTELQGSLAWGAL